MAGDRKKDFLFALEILAITSFVWRKLIFEPWRVSKGPLVFMVAASAGLLAVLALSVSWILKAAVSFLASRTQEGGAKLRESVILTLAPFLFLGLTFLQPVLNFNDIDPTLLAVSGLSFVYLQLIFLTSLKKAQSSPEATSESRLDSVSKDRKVKRLSLHLFLVTALAYVLYSSGLIVPALPFTGDEPHYLLIAKSLLADGDINLFNNHLNKDYLKFYPGELEVHAYPGKKGDRYLYSKHQPALSALVAPFFFLGEKLGQWVSDRGGNADQERRILIFFSRLPICFLAAFLSIAFFLYVWEMTRKRNTAILSWLVFSFGPPLFFYSHLLYPEIIVALILLLVSLRIIQKKNFSPGSLFGAGIGIGLLPWYGIKYVVPAVTIALIIFFLYLKWPGKSIKMAFAFVGPLLLSAGLFLTFLFHLYGTLSPQTVYLGAAPEGGLSLARFVDLNLSGVLIRLLGYLFDQRVGVFVIAPVYILLLPGLFFLVRRAKKEALLLAGLFSVFWCFCSLNRFYWGGYCPPGRPLLPVLWVLALFTAGAFAFSRNRASLVGRDMLVALGLFIAAVFIRNPSLLFQESLGSPRASVALGTGSAFLAQLKNLFIDWRTIVPSLSSPLRANIDWTPLLIWIPAILGTAALFLFSRKQITPESSLRSLGAHLSGAALLSVLFIGNASFNIGPEKASILKGQGYEVISQDENAYAAELGGFWVRGKSKAALIIKTAEPAATFAMSLSSPIMGKTTVRLSRETKPVERTSETGLEQSVVFLSPRGFRWKGNTLYRLEIQEQTGFYPWRINRGSQDSRFLGVFIKLQVDFSRSRLE